MTGVMTPGGPSPPMGDCHELRNSRGGTTTVESDARVLLTASLDVVGAPAGNRRDRGAAVAPGRGGGRRGFYPRRVLLWGPPPRATAAIEGRRFVPPSGSTVGTQPGRERPHPRRWVPDPNALRGVAHVPAAESKSSAHSARGRLVLCTSESRPRFNSPIVAQAAPLSGEVRGLVSA